MKNWLLFAAVLLLYSTTGMAQNNKGAKTAKPATTTVAKTKLTPEQKAKATVEKMNKACALKPEQVTKIETAYLEYYKKHDALKKQKDILSKDVYEQREDDMKKTRNTVLKSTLTAGQYKQWQAAKDKEKATDKKENEEE